MVNTRAGFSLIELLVTISILAILLAIGVPLTTTWVQRARVSEATSKLSQAYGLALALAQRNPNGSAQGAAAAGLKLVDQGVLVCAGDPTSCAAGSTAVKWKATFPSNAAVAIGASGVKTLALDNTGIPLATSDFTVSCGNESESGTLK